jgi:hypothetical protein
MQIRNQREKLHRTVHLTEESGVFHFSPKIRPWYPLGPRQKNYFVGLCTHTKETTQMASRWKKQLKKW